MPPRDSTDPNATTDRCGDDVDDLSADEIKQALEEIEAEIERRRIVSGGRLRIVIDGVTSAALAPGARCSSMTLTPDAEVVQLLSAEDGHVVATHLMTYDDDADAAFDTQADYVVGTTRLQFTTTREGDYRYKLEICRDEMRGELDGAGLERQSSSPLVGTRQTLTDVNSLLPSAPCYPTFPYVRVDLPDGTNVRIGTENSSHANELDQDPVELTDDVTLVRSAHTITMRRTTSHVAGAHATYGCGCRQKWARS